MTNVEKAFEEAVHKIVQDEVAGEMWYESRQNEERLQKLLSNMEAQLVSLLHTQREALIAKLEARKMEASTGVAPLIVGYHRGIDDAIETLRNQP